MAPSSGVETKLNADAQLQTFPYPVYKKIEDFSRLSDKVVFTNFTDQKSDGETLTNKNLTFPRVMRTWQGTGSRNEVSRVNIV